VTFIHLQQNKYEEYEGIRIFFDFESMKEAKKSPTLLPMACWVGRL
jgi:hypothetical protein